MDGEYSFSWNTSSAVAVSLASYKAEYIYNDVTKSGNIEVTYNQTNADEVKTYYRLNKGVNTPFDETIASVPVPDANGVRNGNSVSGIREYEIVIELYAENIMEHRTTFKIWNIPGMTISFNDPDPNIGTKTITEITVLSAIPDNASGQYVLANDIEVNNHTPINNFQGKFYGNGHSVIISGITAAADMGLFGTVSGGIVRDLTVQYSGSVTGPASESRLGGIAGTATTGTKLENVLVLGSFTFNVNGDNTAYVGGIAGQLTGTGTSGRTTLINAYSNLNITVNKDDPAGTTASTQALYVGGVTGVCGGTSSGGIATVKNTNVFGDITVGSSSKPVSVYNEVTSNTTSGLFVGGITGLVRGSGSSTSNRVELNDSHYRQGTITVWSNKGTAILGGFIGRAYSNGYINNCSVISKSFDTYKYPDTSDNGRYFMGGFCGDLCNTTATIEDCYSEGSVVLNSNSNVTGQASAGGFIGRLNGKISYCYAKGEVSAIGQGQTWVGGFMGVAEYSTVKSCYATGNVSFINKGSKAITYAGGFAGYCLFSSSLSDCYALGNVFADKPTGDGEMRIGGFAGNTMATNHSFAKGSVTVQRQESGTINVGGFSGYASDNNVQTSAALGLSVSATGPGTINIGRVYGTNNTGTDNYAYNGMRLYTSAVYGDGRPVELIAGSPETTDNPIPAAANKHGADAHLGTFRSISFWQTTLGFSDANWIFTTVSYYGYPILKGADGMPLGGQQ